MFTPKRIFNASIFGLLIGACCWTDRTLNGDAWVQFEWDESGSATEMTLLSLSRVEQGHMSRRNN